MNEVVAEIHEESGGAPYPVTASAATGTESGKMQKVESRFDIDLSAMQFDSDVVDGISMKLDGLQEERHGDRLMRLERSLLRLERVNLEILTMLQKLVTAVKKPQKDMIEESSP